MGPYPTTGTTGVRRIVLGSVRSGARSELARYDRPASRPGGVAPGAGAPEYDPPARAYCAEHRRAGKARRGLVVYGTGDVWHVARLGAAGATILQKPGTPSETNLPRRRLLGARLFNVGARTARVRGKKNPGSTLKSRVLDNRITQPPHGVSKLVLRGVVHSRAGLLGSSKPFWLFRLPPGWR